MDPNVHASCINPGKNSGVPPERWQSGPGKHASNQNTGCGYGDARNPPEDQFNAGSERRIPGDAVEAPVDDTYESKSTEEWEIMRVVLQSGQIVNSVREGVFGWQGKIMLGYSGS